MMIHCAEMIQSRQPRNNTINCEDEYDSFSVESLKNRVVLASRSAFDDLSTTGRSNDCSTDDNHTYSLESSPSSLSSPSMNSTTIPPEIALMHKETNSLLDSIRSSGDNANMISPPLMEDELDDSCHERDLKEKRNLQEDFDLDDDDEEYNYDFMDDNSYASFLSDDDGMKNEVDQLELAIEEIHKDMEGVFDLELAIGGFDTDDEKHLPAVSKMAFILKLLFTIFASYSLISMMKGKSLGYGSILQDSTMPDIDMQWV